MNRVLVLGADLSLEGVDSFSWREWSAVPSVDDYELVVVHLGSISEDDDEISRDHRRDQFARFILTRAAGELVLIGESNLGGIPYYWLPMFPIFHEGRGTGIAPLDSRFGRWFELVGSYERSMRADDFQPHSNREAYMRSVHSSLGFAGVSGTALATTPAGHAVGLELHFDVHWPDTNTIEESRLVVWLPEPTRTDPTTAIRMLLVDIYGLGDVSPEPAWLESWSTPVQREVQTRIETLTNDRQVLDEALRLERQKLSVAARVRRILYLQGNELEAEVRHTLGLLDVVVRPPPRAGWHDGTLTTTTGAEGVLEIKGLTGPVRVEDVRQLDQWVTDLRFPDAADRWSGQGLFVANAYCRDQPDERPAQFTDAAIDFALQRGYRLVTTRSVFEAVSAMEEGELDTARWWDDVLTGAGPL